jgi:hypothetical protein
MLLARIRKNFNADLARRMLFETPTVAALAERIDAIVAAKADAHVDLDNMLSDALDELTSLTATESQK